MPFPEAMCKGLLREARAEYHERLPLDDLHNLVDYLVEVTLVVGLGIVHLAFRVPRYRGVLFEAVFPGHGYDGFRVLDGHEHHHWPLARIHCPLDPLEVGLAPFLLDYGDRVAHAHHEGVVLPDVLGTRLYLAQQTEPVLGFVELHLLDAYAELHADLLRPVGTELVALFLLPPIGYRIDEVGLV